LLNAAPTQLRAMILLGIDGALGNSDLANLPLSALDLKGGQLNYTRVKTGIDRRIPLWSETVEALRAVIANRREPTDPIDAGLVFLTTFGQRWVRSAVVEEKHHGKKEIKAKFDDAIAKAFGRLLDTLGLKRPRIGFYTLRHTFGTIAGGCKDQAAVDSILGHSDPSRASESRHGIDDARLRAVVEHVQQWLFSSEDKN
jgi:integrase